jgi:hypothetical protein
VQLPNGARSNEVVMRTGPAELALYSADDSGTGQVLALNEDGTLNSPEHPARRGTIVTLPANGVDDPNLKGTLHTGWRLVSVSIGTFPGIPGESPLIQVMIDADLPSGIQALPLVGPTLPGHQPVILCIDSGTPAQSRCQATHL